MIPNPLRQLPAKNLIRPEVPFTVMFLIDILGKIGGAERNLSLLAGGLKSRGHKVIIVALKGGQMAGKIRQEGFYVKEINLTRIYDVKGLIALFMLIKIARREKVSAIISYHDSSDVMGLLVSTLLRIPIISSRRDMGFKLKPRHVLAYRILNRFFSQIATVSTAIKKEIVTTQGATPDHITVIPNGVDLSIEICAPSEDLGNIENKFEIDDKLLKICCLANIHPIKGHAVLIEAAHLVAKQFPAVRFFLIGKKDTDTDYYNDLCGQVEAFELNKFIKFTGALPSEQVVTVLKKTDISVLPSFSEGMSNTILESMVAAKPVVATVVGGNSELVVDGKTGYLVPPGDPQSLSQALLKLLLKPELRCEMGVRGRSRVESLFTVEQMVDRYEDLIKNVCQKKKASRWMRTGNS